MEIYKDVTGCKLVVPRTSDAVLLGTAMAAAVTGGLYANLASAGEHMYPGGTEYLPDPRKRALYDREYRRFLAMYRHRDELERIA